ncbi:hypothetical protein COU59_03610 [Candidatus Pacearchaeota archaeon CG10_big_fil_rev_8_21_14_0_10_34_12]|nr:MAG: hypothetical protein COU59_03610 [Candidatus Pacearchaeota archaeon CG10_big_fil_rev_8_21_14_0_10_34_12]
MSNQIFLTEKNFSKLKEEIRKNKGKEIIFSSDDDNLNRKVLEKLPIDILLINLKERKDFQKQRSSGFNHVLAKIAKKGNVTIGINLDEILNSEEKKKAEILSRIRQNVTLCNKNMVKMKFISQKEKGRRDSHDLRALGLVLGMPTWMTKKL